MTKLEVEARTDETGAIRIRLPGRPASYHVHVTVEWNPEEPDEGARRKATFAELRRAGNPDVLAFIQRVGEAGIENPHALLFVGATADAPIERPDQPPLESRDEL